MKLVDRQGRLVEVPDEQVPQALQSGQFGVPEGARPTFVKPSGEVVSIEADPGKVLQAYQQGYRTESPEQRAERLRQVTYGGPGGQALAGVLGAARGLSFGASDWAASALGFKDEVREIEKANPGMSTFGEIAGIAGPLLVPGGQAKAASLLGKIGAPVRGVAKTGQAVEKATLKALGGAEGGMVRRALAKGAALGSGAGVEGALYGAGQWSSDVALGDADATAESLMGYVKTGALWGGLTGGALGSGGQVLKGAVGSGKAFASKGARAIRKMWETARGRKAIDGVDEVLEDLLAKPGVYDDVMGAYTGSDPAAIARLRKDPEALKRATENLGRRDDVARRMAQLRDKIRATSDEVAGVTRGKVKDEYFQGIASEGDRVAAAETVKDYLGGLRTELDEMLAQPGTYGHRGSIRKLQKIVDDTDSRVNGILSKGEPDLGGRLFNELDGLKQSIGNLRSKMNRIRQPGNIEIEAMDKFSDMFMAARSPLEDAGLWGQRAASTQKAVNEKWTAYLRRSKFRRKYRTDRIAGEVDWGITAADDGARFFEADPGEYRRLIDDMGQPQSDLDMDWIRGQEKLRQDLLDEIDRHYDLGPRRSGAVSEHRQASEEMLSLMDDMEKTVGLRNQLDDIVRNSSQMGAALPAGIGGVGGFLVGGPMGAAAGVLLSPLSNPGRLLHLKAAFHRMKTKFNLDVVRGIQGYMRKASGKAGDAARKTFVPASLKVLQESHWGDKRTKDEDRYEAFHRRYQELTEFLSQPEMAVSRMQRTMDAIHEAAPQVASRMAQKSMQAAQWLHDKAPKPPGRTVTEGLFGKRKWRPADVDLAKWERYVAAVQDPMELIRELEAGALSVDTVEAVRQVYPRLYESIVTTIAEQIPELQDELPYNERVQLSVLFDLPVEETMDNDFIASMQQVVRAQGPMQAEAMRPAQKPKPRTRAGAFRKMEAVGENQRTQAQAVAMRAATAES